MKPIAKNRANFFQKIPENSWIDFKHNLDWFLCASAFNLNLDLDLDLDHNLNLSFHTFRSNLEKLKKSKIKIKIKIEIKIKRSDLFHPKL